VSRRLIKSVSGIRGIIGGFATDGLTPIDIVEFVAAFGSLTVKRDRGNTIIVGRDGRVSGEMVSSLAIQTLIAQGFHVIDLGLSTTPTVEMAVISEKAAGGIIFTASHNPFEWNALKFLNNDGEFISAEDGEKLMSIAKERNFAFVEAADLGTLTKRTDFIQKHIDAIFKLPLVKSKAIKDKKFKIVVDCINSTGAISVIPLLEQLGCEVIAINSEINGQFAHNPEPLPENLSDLADAVKEHKAHMGFAVDPDVDRLVIVCEDGEMFGEEYTLVAVADYVLSHTIGNTVSNLSSTKALEDITIARKAKYYPSAVGEVHVVKKMKEVNAVIGGEGNGGIIYPELHYGRDALVGIALFLSLVVEYKKPVSFLKKSFPKYTIAKKKIILPLEISSSSIIQALTTRYKTQKLNQEDGLRINMDSGWVHIRQSNTEPIMRIIAESDSITVAENLADKLISDISQEVKIQSLGQ
jgi:phosphomannomutase